MSSYPDIDLNSNNF